MLHFIGRVLSSDSFYSFVMFLWQMWLTVMEEKKKVRLSESREEKFQGDRALERKCSVREDRLESEEGQRKLQWHNKDCLELSCLPCYLGQWLPDHPSQKKTPSPSWELTKRRSSPRQGCYRSLRKLGIKRSQGLKIRFASWEATPGLPGCGLQERDTR